MATKQRKFSIRYQKTPSLKASRILSKVRKTNTKPEVRVRRWLHNSGYRFRLHRADLPGCPDIVMAKWGLVIQVHGCFWHQHGCAMCRRPTSNVDYWIPKLEGNVKRDRANRAKLKRLGWKVGVIWECETLDPAKLEKRMLRLLQASSSK
jgi:DNA mismatch endonuclease (patch repair protein)